MIYRKRERKTWVYLFMATASMMLLAITAFTAVSLIAVRNTAYRQTEENLREFGYAITHYLASNNDLAETEALRTFCKALGAGPEFRLTIINADGTVLADSSADPSQLENHATRPEVRAALDGKEEGIVRFSHSLDKQLVYYAIPYRQMVIRLATTADYIAIATRQMMTTLTIAALIILLIALAVSFIASSRIIIPLQLLESAAHSYSEGNLDIQYRTDNFPKEFIKLSQTFSLMADKLREKISALDDQNRETSAILSGMNDALIVLDPENKVLRVNRAAETLFGISAQDSVGAPLIQAVRNTDIVDFAQTNADAQAERIIELRTAGRNDLRFLLVNSSRIEPGAGQLLVFNDITRLKTLERIRKDFVANVSHELKTPVTSIKGFIETLKDGAINDPAAAKRFLDIMDQQSSRLGAIIDDLLMISRLEQNDLVVIPKELTRLSDVMDNVKNLCQEEALKKQTKLTFICPADAACGINPGLLEQAITNLVLNAVKHSPEKRTVEIQARLEKDSAGKDRLIITVRDDGVGIPEKHLARIFERFYRVDPGRSREQGGTGLGLSIVRHIALAHGGTVSVESAEGTGSTFRLDIPV